MLANEQAHRGYTRIHKSCEDKKVYTNGVKWETIPSLKKLIVKDVKFTNEALTEIWRGKICKYVNIKLSEQCNTPLYENTQYIWYLARYVKNHWGENESPITIKNPLACFW